MTTREEMETTLVYDHIEKVWRFYSTCLVHTREFLADTRARVCEEGDGWVSGVFAGSDCTLNGFFKRSASEAQRAAAREQMRRIHATRAGAGDDHAEG